MQRAEFHGSEEQKGGQPFVVAQRSPVQTTGALRVKRGERGSAEEIAPIGPMGLIPPLGGRILGAGALAPLGGLFIGGGGVKDTA